MPIRCDTEVREFHRYNDTFSYSIRVFENGHIGLVYRACPFLSPDPGGGLYPYSVRGDYRYPAFTPVFENGASPIAPRSSVCQIGMGKPELPGLPSFYIENEEESGILELPDESAKVQVILSYSILRSQSGGISLNFIKIDRNSSLK
jgi:hypothetical protein